jgi:hypothetical protein
VKNIKTPKSISILLLIRGYQLSDESLVTIGRGRLAPQLRRTIGSMAIALRAR